MYLRKVFFTVSEFLKKEKIDFVFGEFSWAHELTIYSVCKQLGIKYFHPAPHRVDDNSFIFTTHYFQHLIGVSKNKKNKHKKISIEKYQNNTLHFPQPSIFLKLINFYFDDYYAKDDVCRKSKYLRLFNFILKLIRKIIYRTFWGNNYFKLNKKNRYFVYFLHKSPEAGINVKGMFYENELQNIINISRVLEREDVLLIKEHPTDEGNKPIYFYKRLNKLPNISLVSNFYETTVLEKDFEAIFTISGTIAIDMGLKGQTCLTFGDNWFNFIPWVKKISYDDLRNNSINDIIKVGVMPNSALINKLHKVIDSISFKGDVNDFEIYPHKNNDENIINLVKSFELFMSSYVIKNSDDLHKELMK